MRRHGLKIVRHGISQEMEQILLFIRVQMLVKRGLKFLQKILAFQLVKVWVELVWPFLMMTLFMPYMIVSLDDQTTRKKMMFVD